jgi:hypothetical protein
MLSLTNGGCCCFISEQRRLMFLLEHMMLRYVAVVLVHRNVKHSVSQEEHFSLVLCELPGHGSYNECNWQVIIYSSHASRSFEKNRRNVFVNFISNLLCYSFFLAVFFTYFLLIFFFFCFPYFLNLFSYFSSFIVTVNFFVFWMTNTNNYIYLLSTRESIYCIEWSYWHWNSDYVSPKFCSTTHFVRLTRPQSAQN